MRQSDIPHEQETHWKGAGIGVTTDGGEGHLLATRTLEVEGPPVRGPANDGLTGGIPDEGFGGTEWQ